MIRFIRVEMITERVCMMKEEYFLSDAYNLIDKVA